MTNIYDAATINTPENVNTKAIFSSLLTLTGYEKKKMAGTSQLINRTSHHRSYTTQEGTEKSIVERYYKESLFIFRLPGLEEYLSKCPRNFGVFLFTPETMKKAEPLFRILPYKWFIELYAPC